ncbi:efflux transporter outer membrane subunit [Sphingomonas sp. HF-S3]|uniref:Efflux transporter outer membrane subunit n=1 Tax=Sphingomonas rustica TaxID=3103142 RepID=A0ABV0BBH4_9SPHN
MRRLSPFILLALASGCTMGPDYKGPPAAPGSTPAAGFVRAEPDFVATAPHVAEWWTAFNDATLNDIQRRALSSSPGVAVAQARLRQARATLRLDRANRAPALGAQGMYVHAELPGLDLGSSGSGNSGGSGSANALDLGSIDFFNLGFDASWEIDLFGGSRRTVEASRASVEAAQANVADAQVQLTADIAQAYINLRDRQAQLALSQRTVALQQQMLDLVRQRRSRGASSDLDVERLQTQVRATQAQAVPIEAEIVALKNALAVLAGDRPGALDPMLDETRPVPLPPAQIAIGDPEQLLKRRPDIRAAERNLAARTAQIGVAEASRFPRLSLMGMIGLGGTSPSDLVDLDNLSALAMPRLQWQFLDFGRGRARVGQAEGRRDEAEAQYRQAVLGALRDAEDALARFGSRRRAIASLEQVRASAERAAELMQQRQRAGTATLIDALDAERQRVVAEQNVATAVAALTNDFVALQKALGLGWSDAG